MLSKHRLAFIEGEDSAQVLVRFDNGVVGQMVTSWAYEPAPVTERFSAVGELGSLHSGGGEGTSLTVTIRDGASETFEFDEVDTYVAEIGHFADALIAGTRPLHTEEEGIAVLGILLAAYEGAARKTIAPVVAPVP
jgi:predicted dehydrogenase